MQPSNAEIKIVEKIKFWEEQEKINGVLVERLLQLNKEMAVIIAESELHKKELLKTISRLEGLSKESTVLRQISSQNTDKIDELENKLIRINDYLERLKNHSTLQNDGEKKTPATGIRAIHVTFILSIIAIVLSAISLVV